MKACFFQRTILKLKYIDYKSFIKPLTSVAIGSLYSEVKYNEIFFIVIYLVKASRNRNLDLLRTLIKDFLKSPLKNYKNRLKVVKHVLFFSGLYSDFEYTEIFFIVIYLVKASRNRNLDLTGRFTTRCIKPSNYFARKIVCPCDEWLNILTVRPWSLDPIHLVTCQIKWVKTSWT